MIFKAWCVVLPEGEPVLASIADRKETALLLFRDSYGGDWSVLKKQGYRLRRCEIRMSRPLFQDRD
jgi:hypothetical protein